MNNRPTPTAAPLDADLIHSSTFTVMSTNAEDGAHGRHRALFRVTKCEIRWIDGDVAVRFSGHTIDVTPRTRTQRAAR